jgi:hypothetical protein
MQIEPVDHDPFAADALGPLQYTAPDAEGKTYAYYQAPAGGPSVPLTPVDHDPFDGSQSQHRSVADQLLGLTGERYPSDHRNRYRLIPVDHDPFAAAPQ